MKKLHQKIEANAFYPTPDSLAQKLLDMVPHIDGVVPDVLEPTAGKGDLAEAFVRRHMLRKWETEPSKSDRDHVDCIEISPDLAYILRGRGFRVIHDDFTTFRSEKRYGLVLMNPPFNRGAEFLMRAMDIVQPYGGTVACILNAETIRKTHTYLRHRLKMRLEQYGAKIEYVKGAFSTAERSTDVEVALVCVEVPASSYDSIVLDSLRKAEQAAEFDKRRVNALAQGDYIDVAIKAFKLEERIGITILREFSVLSKMLPCELLGKDEYNKDHILNLTFGGYPSDRGSGTVTVNEYLRRLRRKYWRGLFHNPDFTKKLTTDLRNELYNRVSEFGDYDFTHYNIFQLLQDMNDRALQGIEAAIMKMFEDLTHKYHWHEGSSNNRHYFDGWKTNEAWRIGKRVVIPYLNAWDDIFKCFRYTFDINSKMQDIEKCFEFLGGKKEGWMSASEYLAVAERNKQSAKIECKYFIATFYKKGTCHLEFTDEELLHKLNIFAAKGKNWLPPTYGRAAYSSMTPEERKVVDSFEGEEHYSKVMENKDYYLSYEGQLRLTSSDMVG